MRKKRRWMIPLLAVVLLAAVFFAYVGSCRHSEADARAALASDEAVHVSKTEYGWFFDGPSEERSLIFYPGGKVEETAYAPLLRRLAENGLDVFLVRMPFHLAIFDMNRAAEVMKEADYAQWYVGGHSLGGAMAAVFAAGNPEGLDGVILFAAYPTKTIDERLLVISVYGAEDGVLDMEKVTEGRQYLSGTYVEHVIPGGNHAQFGNYGWQKGDGEASVTAAEQQAEAVSAVIGSLNTYRAEAQTD